MTNKTLGQVAYEAWHLEHMSPGLSAPYSWAQEHPDGRKAWQAAAEAVVKATTPVVRLTSDEERAVIEAARSGDTQAIAEAVKRLDEVENEQE